MRLLSFLTDIEQAVRTEAAANNDATVWVVTRMVNFHQSMARMTISVQESSELLQPRGAIFLQTFTLADGSLCLKACLHWEGSEITPVVAVYSKPSTNWKSEAKRVATAWMQGPAGEPTTSLTETLDQDELSRLVATG